MNTAFIQRIIGAFFVITSGVIFIPYFLDGSPQEAQATLLSSIPVPPPAPLVAEIPPATQQVVLPKPFEPTAPVIASAPALPSTPPAMAVNKVATAVTVPATSASLSKDNMWTVQVGVYIDAQRAIAVEQQLRAKGYAAYRRAMPNTALTQLFIGPEFNQANAKAMALQLQHELRVAAVVVPFNDTLKVALQQGQ